MLHHTNTLSHHIIHAQPHANMLATLLMIHYLFLCPRKCLLFTYLVFGPAFCISRCGRLFCSLQRWTSVCRVAAKQPEAPSERPSSMLARAGQSSSTGQDWGEDGGYWTRIFNNYSSALECSPKEAEAGGLCRVGCMFLSLLLEAELGATWGLQLPLFSVRFPSHRLHLTGHWACSHPFWSVLVLSPLPAQLPAALLSEASRDLACRFLPWLLKAVKPVPPSCFFVYTLSYCGILRTNQAGPDWSPAPASVVPWLPGALLRAAISLLKSVPSLNMWGWGFHLTSLSVT